MIRNEARSTLASVTSVLLGTMLFGCKAEPPAAEPDPRLVVHYALNETSGTVATDSSGNGRDGTVSGGAAWQGSEGLALDGVDDFVQLPNDVLGGLTSITVSTEVLIKPAQTTPYLIWGLGNPVTGSQGTGYLSTTGNDYRTAITGSNQVGEQDANSHVALARGVWKTLTYTLSGGVATLYLDGEQVAQRTGVSVTPASIGGGTTTANYIGRSVYASDAYLLGNVRDFRIYDAALSAADVAGLVASEQTRVDRDAAALTLGDLSAVESSLILPLSGPNGAAITWTSSDPDVLSASGDVTRPDVGEGNATITLSATLTRGAASTRRDFTVTVLALPGDQGLVDAAAAALRVVNVDDVRGNLTLPTTQDGIPVSWRSSDPSIVSATGEVHRQTADTQVRLTATLVHNGARAQRVFTATVRAAVKLAPFEGYAFAYFTGSSLAGENIFFAASQGNDALRWTELHGGLPVFTSSFGTKGLRDPFIVRSPEGDTFYLIATDLSIGSGTSWDAAQRTGSKYIEVWESHDLVTWSEQRHVKVSPDTAGNTWAPEAYYDESIGAYVVFWASKLYDPSDTNHTGTSYNRMLYATTRDFVTFSEPRLWQDPGMSVIDSTVLKEGETYYRFTKDEGRSTGCSDIIQEKSTDLRAFSPSAAWTTIASCIGRGAGTGAVEGPTAFKANPGDVNGAAYYLFVDEYSGRGYIPLATSDISQPAWVVPDDYDLPASPRHGTVIPVTRAELEALTAGVPEPAPVNAAGEILRYNFEDGAGSVLHDVSGNGQDGTIVGGATWQASGALRFDGVDDYVKMPRNLLAGVTDVTVEAEVYLDASQSGAYFVYGLGNTDAAGAGKGYLFATGNSVYRASITTGNYQTEQTAASSAPLPREQWVHLVYTLEGSTATLYLNGQVVAVKTGVTIEPGDIGGGMTVSNYLGRSLYNADKYFVGQYREFALYNRALSASEVLVLSGNKTAVANASR
ncbi:family 43 glycosylhydrolase [Archangium violaceum]|uniref:LamG-like jellyroll fold domain-containing protein n=1 Tax=Archangium violaceum TaxID=83451 RepID=UPI00193B8787|nr:LamG-like jellyroll fold domain-containing protein [Archangium violaceum]QRK11372.1 family 43 glycosylhydrolase [Archangium violaceum]